VGRLPAPGDNAAIAVRRLEAGTRVEHAGLCFALGSTVLEGHRFAVRPIPAGEPLLSWGLPFGVALRPIAAGEYLCNAKMLGVLRQRGVDFPVPGEPNFEDSKLEPYRLEERSFVPGVQVAPHAEPRYFEGYRRAGERGVGTRNYIVILGTTSRTASYARALAERLEGVAGEYPNVDGIVPVAHTEGGGEGTPNNLELLLRTLAGFVVHPNVGAVLVADYPDGAVTNRTLRAYMEEHGHGLSDVLHHFFSLEGGFEESLRRGEEIVRGWLPRVDAFARTPEPLSSLKVALQCGGSDAFSGVSGNPLAGWVAKEIIRYGGSANLAETDELIGAEAHVLANVRDLDTARAFLDKVAGFKELVGRHGHTAEDNPSGGNNFRGLYNITIKSIGAAMKRDSEVRLDSVLGYAAPMSGPGFYFMDSPGNDLESIAGQVASGCNMIFFVTGNGSITNFPFVPTLKVVTTTRRYRLLSQEMDVNAGAYLDGVPLEELGRDMLDLTVRAASGERTAGERAGHSQVSIWRNWAQGDDRAAKELQTAAEPSGEPLPIRTGGARRDLRFSAYRTPRGHAADQVGLVLPTSLCSGQIARLIAARLNERGVGEGRVSRFVALPHTEGCGVSAGSAEVIYARTMLGYLLHPLVRHALLLEHGCEKTHNDYMRGRLAERGVAPDSFGWASVQLDGGIENVGRKVEEWFGDVLASAPEPEREPVGLEGLRLGLASAGAVPESVAASLSELTRVVVGAGGTVVVPENAGFLGSPAFLDEVLGGPAPRTTLAYGQAAELAGFHVMETPTDHWVETLTGLGATGMEVVLAYTAGRPLQAHRLVPVLQVSDAPRSPDLDLVLGPDSSSWADELLGQVLRVAGGEYTPRLYGQGNADFQLTRGLLGVSM
jgi:altronate dehydratase